MALSAAAVYDHLVAFRSGLSENIWMSRVDAPVLAVFSQLLASAKKLAPEGQVLRVIEDPGATVRPGTLLMLVDQMLVALDGCD
jgi:hypothetical protein